MVTEPENVFGPTSRCVNTSSRPPAAARSPSCQQLRMILRSAEAHASGGKLKTRMVLRSRLPPDALATHRHVLATRPEEVLDNLVLSDGFFHASTMKFKPSLVPFALGQSNFAEQTPSWKPTNEQSRPEPVREDSLSFGWILRHLCDIKCFHTFRDDSRWIFRSAGIRRAFPVQSSWSTIIWRRAQLLMWGGQEMFDFSLEHKSNLPPANPEHGCLKLFFSFGA